MLYNVTISTTCCMYPLLIQIQIATHLQLECDDCITHRPNKNTGPKQLSLYPANPWLFNHLYLV